MKGSAEKPNNPIIVLAIFTLQGGGAERFVLTLSEAFARLGFAVHIISFKRQADYMLDGLHDNVTVHYLNYQAYRWLPKGALRYRSFARHFDRFIYKNIGTPTLALSNLYQVDAVLHYSKLPSIAYVIHNTVSVEYGLNRAGASKKQAELKLLYANHPIVCVSQGVADDFVKVFGKRDDIVAIHNPIPQHDIYKQAQAFYPDLPSVCDGGYIVHVGKFKPQKNHKHLITAYAASDKALPLVLLGTGGLQAECQALCSELDIEERVIFAGFQANPYAYIKHASAMVLSSDFEGFGIVIGEALSLGVPVISTDCPHGPSELLPKNNLVPVGDVEALAEKMDKVMDNPQAFLTPFDKKLLPEYVARQYLDFMGVDI